MSRLKSSGSLETLLKRGPADIVDIGPASESACSCAGSSSYAASAESGESSGEFSTGTSASIGVASSREEMTPLRDLRTGVSSAPAHVSLSSVSARPRIDSMPARPITPISEKLPGALRSPPDDTDVVFESLIRSMSGRYMLALPSEYDLTHLTLPVRDQMNRSTCAAMVGSTISESHVKSRNRGHNKHLSPEFIYYHRSMPVPGMYPRDTMRVMKTVGVPLEEEYPYAHEEEQHDKPGKRVYRSASATMIEGYARVTSVEGLKRSLVELGLCMITLPLYNQGPTFWRRQPGDHEHTSGHAVAVCGYSDSRGCFIMRNSWGPHWNGNGYFDFPYSDWDSVWECWTCFPANVSKKGKTCNVM